MGVLNSYNKITIHSSINLFKVGIPEIDFLWSIN